MSSLAWLIAFFFILLFVSILVYVLVVRNFYSVLSLIHI